MYVHTCTYVVCAYMYVFTYVLMYIYGLCIYVCCMYIHTCVHLCVCIYMYVSKCMCLINTYICLYVSA